MKANVQATVPTLTAPPALETARAADKSAAAVLGELFKARLSVLVLLTTFVGFYAGWRGPMAWGLMLHTVLGTALLAAGASALNQLLERDEDAKMRRTRDRPLPSGRVTPEAALMIGGVCAAAGLAWLALAVNLLTALLGALTLAVYVLVYTPLKRVTAWNTAIGAIPGALPPLMGWTAARGEMSGGGWALFAVLFFWQLPHFMAIAWIYREDYARAGFVMLPVMDPAGERTGRQALWQTVGLLAASLCPLLFGLAGAVYLAGALALGAGFLWRAFQFSRRISEAGARRLFYASILYLPLLLALMVFDKK
jgi:protoheme IX farnesyltransferase